MKKKKERERYKEREIALTLEEWSSLSSKGFRAEFTITLETHTPAVDMPFSVVLDGHAPWGFRLIGGRDFSQPLTVAKISPGSKASRVNLSPGDIILAIDGVSAENMMHSEAQNLIKDATYQLTLTVERPETKLWSPSVTEQNKSHPFKINLEAERQECSPIGTGHNRKASPFVAAANIDETRQVVSPTYNSPIGLYSSGNIQDALQGQLKGLIHGKPGSPRKLNNIEESEVYRMLQRDQDEDEPHEPRQSGSFKAIQSFIDSEGTCPLVKRKVRAPMTKSSAPAGNLHKLPMCDKCGNGIIGTVVKVQDKFRHPDCFVCAECEENLKQKGYYFIDDELYCETHAHARAKPPESPDL
ncbi:PDZ and LIM domain protein 3 [Carassius gibelio]|uniref:PDZ and LIM domain protein 3 n=1 Tax=Carassius gibelio TaxID=101364 RepID=UPI002278387E|nr:PDZ and LIM domain protein 3 [Carassius gibelio]